MYRRPFALTKARRRAAFAQTVVRWAGAGSPASVA
jgi:hypothetical protein